MCNYGSYGDFVASSWQLDLVQTQIEDETPNKVKTALSGNDFAPKHFAGSPLNLRFFDIS